MEELKYPKSKCIYRGQQEKERSLIPQHQAGILYDENLHLLYGRVEAHRRHLRSL